MFPHLRAGWEGRIIRASGHYSTAEPTATAPPAAVAVDAEQAQRDVWFAELVERCKTKQLLESTIAFALAECGRSRDELDDAIEREEITEGTSNVAGANLNRVCEKESNMTTTEKAKIKSEWDAALRNMQSAHPQWPYSKCLSAVVRENPALHKRFLDAANSR